MEPRTKSGTARRLAIALSVLVSIAGAGVALAWDHVVPRNFGVVEPGKLYRSGRLTPAATRRVVEAHEIKTIVDLGAYDKDEVGGRVAQRTADALGVERFVFGLHGDGTGNPNAYVAALRVMTDPSKQPVLVHCSAGAQRTSACVVLYRGLVQGRERADVMHEAYAHEHDPEDNPRMAPYLDEWTDEIGRALRDGGWVAGQSPMNVRPKYLKAAEP